VATTLVNSESRATAPPHSARGSRQQQPSGLADGRAGPQLRALRSTDRNGYNPCKTLTPRCRRESASCRAAVETWRTQQCFFQRRAKHSQRVRACLPCSLLSRMWASPTLRSSSMTNTGIWWGVSIFYRCAKCQRSICNSPAINKMCCCGVVRLQSGSTS
jgi:hypothetical protein